jgi:hypothetical protein
MTLSVSVVTKKRLSEKNSEKNLRFLLPELYYDSVLDNSGEKKSIEKFLLNNLILKECVFKLWLQCLTFGQTKTSNTVANIYGHYESFCFSKCVAALSYRDFRDGLQLFVNEQRRSQNKFAPQLRRQSNGLVLPGLKPSYYRLSLLDDFFFCCSWTLESPKMWFGHNEENQDNLTRVLPGLEFNNRNDITLYKYSHGPANHLCTSDEIPKEFQQMLALCDTEEDIFLERIEVPLTVNTKEVFLVTESKTNAKAYLKQRRMKEAQNDKERAANKSSENSNEFSEDLTQAILSN